jgi:hypothetical protein
MQLITRLEGRKVRRSWPALITVLATVLVAGVAAASSAAATGPPKSTARPTITGTAVVGKVLSAHPGSWSGTLPITFKFQWARCSATGTGCTNITEAAQSQSFILTSDDLGHKLVIHVTATNSAGTNSRDSLPTAVVKPAPVNAPVNTTPPAISGSPIEGNTMTASNGSWSGATATYAYQWQRCDTAGADCHSILGASSQTYTPTSLDVGGTLRVVVTATNSNGSGSSISHQSATIRSAASVQVTLHASATVVVYGRSVTLSGTVAGASSGDVVTILARTGLNQSLQPVGTTTTDANGAFSKSVTPRLRTVYVAKGDGAQSSGLTINVRPGMRLRHVVGGSLAVSVTAAKSFVGRYVNVQTFVNARWSTVKRVFLTRRSFGPTPTIYSTATFRLSVKHGLKVRAFLTLSQSGPNYTSATSNTVRS